MLDLCGRHGGTCGSKALHIREGDSCDVVREVCQQVDEDSKDYENAFQHDLNDYGMVHLDVHRVKMIVS